MSDREHEPLLPEHLDRAACRTPRNAELLNELELTGDRPIRLPRTLLDSLGQNLDQL